MNSSEQTTVHLSKAPPDGHRALPAPPASDALVARLAEEMAQAWERGERPRAEDCLAAHPGLREWASAVMDLVYEEICLCREYGELVETAALVARFPAWKRQIEVLLRCADALEPGGHESFPQAGERIGEFVLLAEIGRGGQGRVFLATQTSLGDRPVVLKITPRSGQEHIALALLQHTHIVPLLSVLDEPARNLRALCMPYFGGLTLAALLVQLGKLPSPWAGRHVLELLDTTRASAAIAQPPGRAPATSFLSRAGQVQVVAWLGACLAEALKYAHERGLVHLDVKPSNILVTADRQPMLLDFHLAREPLAPGEPGARFGGTPAYMSPEQRRALAELRTGGRVAEVVDGRSDVYSLGLVMVEALGGSLPPEGPEPRPLIRCNRAVSLGLSDILTKCLATRPCDRYQDAGALAADLWCELNHQPLRGVANRSVVERWRKWRRRKPHMLSVLGLLAAVLVVAGAALTFAFLHAGHRVDEAQRALSEGQKQIRSGRYKEAAATLERGLAQLARLPFHADLRASLGQRLRMAARSGAAEELHQIADRIRMAYGAEGASASKLRTIEHHCRALWDKRALILDRLGQELEPYVEDRIQTDLLDLAVLGGSLRVRLAEASEGVRARQEALEMLSQAEAFWRPSAVLFHERGLHAGALGLDDVVRAARRGEAEHPPRSTWEHYALGRSLLQGGDPGAAADAFDQALAREPHGLWPNFYRGVASYQLGRFDDAALAFTVSTTLAPGNAGCFYNRALALVGLARPDRALADFNRALELDPVFAEAALDRGRLHFHAGRLREAEADFNLALCEGSIPAQVHFHLALVWLERKDLARAVHHLEACRTVDPTHAHAAQLLEELRRPRS